MDHRNNFNLFRALDYRVADNNILLSKTIYQNILEKVKLICYILARLPKLLG